MLAKMVSANANQFIYSNYIIEHANVDSLYEPFQLTNVQQAYYFGRFISSFILGNTSAHVYIEYEFKFLDISKLEIALNRLIERHHNLRMTFENGKQHYVEHYPRYQVKLYKLKNTAELERIRQYSHKVYEVDQLWLFDMFVSRLKNKYILHFSLDALIFDAYSLWIFLNELSKLYNDPLRSLRN